MSTDLKVSPAHLEHDDDAEVVWRAIERAYAFVDSSGEPDVVAELARLTSGQRALLAIHWCIAETSNGGFDQFFMNTARQLADEAVAGFELIGVPEGSTLLKTAQEALASRPAAPDGEAPEFDEVEDQAKFDSYLAQFDPLQERFYVLVDQHVYAKGAAYVRDHLSEFAT